MKFQDSKGNTIKTISEWKSFLFTDTKKKKHWKKGRSAYEIASFLLEKNGEKKIVEIIESIINEKVELDYGIPEMEVRFDEFGHGREHDVGIFGQTNSGKKIFVGVESKVDETFDKTISEAYIKSKTKEINGLSTNSAKRIENLMKRNFGKIKEDYFNLRYQLLYSTVGTLDAKDKNKNLDIYFLLIIVFKTTLYDEIKGIENYKDYIQFINNLNSKKVHINQCFDLHEVTIEDKTLYSIYLTIDE